MQNQLRNLSVIKAFLSETPLYRDSIKKVLITDQFSVGEKTFSKSPVYNIISKLEHFLNCTL